MAQKGLNVLSVLQFVQNLMSFVQVSPAHHNRCLLISNHRLPLLLFFFCLFRFLFRLLGDLLFLIGLSLFSFLVLFMFGSLFFLLFLGDFPLLLLLHFRRFIDSPRLLFQHLFHSIHCPFRGILKYVRLLRLTASSIFY
jgi:hypothetical protein